MHLGIVAWMSSVLCATALLVPSALAQSAPTATTQELPAQPQAPSLPPQPQSLPARQLAQSAPTPPAQSQPAHSLNLSPSARQLAEELRIPQMVDNYKAKQEEYTRTKDLRALLEQLLIGQKLQDAMQYASIEVEEAVAAIDGDLAMNNMLLAYVTNKRDRAVALGNVATFVGSGTFGLLDTSSSIRLGPPTPNIFGIIGNSIAVGVPAISLRRRTYQHPRHSQAQTNMLAPIFGRPYPGVSYDPVVWTYIDALPAGSKRTQSRREILLEKWRTYRGIGTGTPAEEKDRIDTLVGLPEKNQKLTVDILKTRTELLFDLRAVVQEMYRDISEINTAIMQL